MAHEWNAGILAKSSWHGREIVEKIPDFATLVSRCYQTDAWATVLHQLGVFTEISGKRIKVPGSTIVAEYQSGKHVPFRPVGDRYGALSPESWVALGQAAERAGLRPTGGFSLKGGSRQVMTFADESDTSTHQIRGRLAFADSFDGSLNLRVLAPTFDVVCANTLSMALGEDSANIRVKHTSSIDERASQIEAAIEAHGVNLSRVRETYDNARETRLDLDSVSDILEMVFPTEGKTGNSLTRARNKQSEAAHAMRRPQNARGQTLATVWAGLTWMVDRTPDGDFREGKGKSDAMDSLLLGTRGQQVDSILGVVEMVLRDGSYIQVPTEVAAVRRAENGDDGGLAGLLNQPARIDPTNRPTE